MECINLQEQLGDRYKIAFDPAYDPAHRRKDALDPWSMVIPCRRGTIYPFGGDLLAVEIDGRPRTAKRLEQLEGVTLYQDGDREKTFVFHVGLFPEVARIVQPRRKRRLSAEQRRKAAERLRKYWFQSRTSEQFSEPETADAEGTR